MSNSHFFKWERVVTGVFAGWIEETKRHFAPQPGPFTAAPKSDFDFFMDLDVMVLGLPSEKVPFFFFSS